MGRLQKILAVFVLAFTLLQARPVFSYNVDSLMNVIGQVPFEEKHKKVETEMGRLLDSNPMAAIELGDYWVNILSEKQDAKRSGDILVIIGGAHYRLSNFAMALQYHQTARNLFRSIGNEDGEGKAMTGIGFTYGKMDEYQEAVNYLQGAISIFEKTNNNAELSATYNHLGNIVEEWKNDLGLAEQFYRKSIFHAEQIKLDESISYSLEFIGIIKSKQDQMDSAIYYFNASLELRKKLNLQFPLALSYTNLAEVMDMNGQMKEAEHYYRQALAISKVIQFHDLTKFLYGNLGRLYQKKGNADSAIKYIQLEKSLADSLFDIERAKEVAEVKEKYESELKEEKIRTLNNQMMVDKEKGKRRTYIFTIVIIILGSFFLLAIMLTIIIIINGQRKSAKEKVIQEKLRNKMIIEAEEKERTRIAKDLHDSLGQMLAALKMNLNRISSTETDQLKKTTQILDDTITEMRSISHAMMPESLVKNGLAQALIDISNHVDAHQTTIKVNVNNWKGWNRTGEYVLYRIVQELLNNTLKHAAAKNVNIELNQFDDEINLIYEDDGKGFNPQTQSGGGIGMQNIHNRISSINGQIEFDSRPGSGTTAIISIPLNKEAL